MSYQGADMPHIDAQEPSPNRNGEKRIDAICVVAGLLFIAIAVLGLADRLWAEIDPVLMVGGTVIAVGVAIAVSVIRRSVVRKE